MTFNKTLQDQVNEISWQWAVFHLRSNIVVLNDNLSTLKNSCHSIVNASEASLSHSFLDQLFIVADLSQKKLKLSEITHDNPTILFSLIKNATALDKIYDIHKLFNRFRIVSNFLVSILRQSNEILNKLEKNNKENIDPPTDSETQNLLKNLFISIINLIKSNKQLLRMDSLNPFYLLLNKALAFSFNNKKMNLGDLKLILKEIYDYKHSVSCLSVSLKEINPIIKQWQEIREAYKIVNAEANAISHNSPLIADFLQQNSLLPNVIATENSLQCHFNIIGTNLSFISNAIQVGTIASKEIKSNILTFTNLTLNSINNIILLINFSYPHSFQELQTLSDSLSESKPNIMTDFGIYASPLCISSVLDTIISSLNSSVQILLNSSIIPCNNSAFNSMETPTAPLIQPPQQKPNFS